MVSSAYLQTVTTSTMAAIGLNISTTNVTLSSLSFIDSVTRSTGTLYEQNSLLYFNTYVIGGAFTLFSQVYTA